VTPLGPRSPGQGGAIFEHPRRTNRRRSSSAQPRALWKKSELAKAIRYALSNWVALTRYCEDGRLEINNNAAERALRGRRLGTQALAVAGSDDGGERAAAIYTLLGTPKLNDLNPESYLRYVLERIADHPINQIEELLPWSLLLKMSELRIAA
jgi:transposase